MSTQKVVPTGPWFRGDAQRAISMSSIEANCQSVVNPVLDVGKYLPHSVFPKITATTTIRSRSISTRRCCTRPIRRSSGADARLREACARHAGACIAALLVSDRAARSYVKGWKISPSHYLNQDLATIWLDK